MAAVVWHHAVLWMAKAISSGGFEPNGVIMAAEDLALWLAPLRMPLFTILSGWVYAIRPASTDTVKPFIQGKVRRILIPLFFLSTIQYFQIFWIQDTLPELKFRGQSTPVVPEEFWKLWFFHFGHLWFLQALILIFASILVIDAMGWMKTKRMWLFWMAILFVLPFAVSGTVLSTSFWSMNKAANLSIYFYFGVGAYRFREELFNHKYIMASLILFAIAMVGYALWQLSFVDLRFREAIPIRVLAGVTGSFILLALPLRNRLAAWLGGYSYTVYLYHGLGYELHWLYDFTLGYGTTGHLAWFVLTFASGIFIPILIHKIFAHIPIVRTPVLGKKL